MLRQESGSGTVPSSYVRRRLSTIGRKRSAVLLRQIKTTLVTGLAAERQRIVRHTKEGEVLITSYDLLKRDVELYRDMVFAIQVIDEAQYIKNPGTQAAKGVKQITAVSSWR